MKSIRIARKIIKCHKKNYITYKIVQDIKSGKNNVSLVSFPQILKDCNLNLTSSQVKEQVLDFLLECGFYRLHNAKNGYKTNVVINNENARIPRFSKLKKLFKTKKKIPNGLIVIILGIFIGIIVGIIMLSIEYKTGWFKEKNTDQKTEIEQT